MSQRNARPGRRNAPPEHWPEPSAVRQGGPGPGLSRRSLHSDRRLLATLLVLVAIAAVVSLGVALAGRGPDRAGGPSPLQYTLLSANLLLLFVLCFSLLRYLIRLVLERKAGILGSRFKLKLVAAFIGLCLVPALVLYAAAIAVMFQAVDRTLSPEVERIVVDAEAVAHQFQAGMIGQLAGELRDVAPRLAAVAALGDDALRRALQAAVDDRRLAVARLRRPAGETLQAVGGGWQETLTPAEVDRLLSAPAGEGTAGGSPGFDRAERTAGGLLLLAEASLPDGAGSLVAARKLPADLGERVNRIREATDEHQRVRARRSWFKAEQALLFMGFSLMILLGATWVGLHVARTITIPIELLAKATVAVRRGDLGQVVEWHGGDELAVLVDAFNEMSGDLKLKADAVTRTTEELTEANRALAAANAELKRRRDDMERLLQTMTAGVLALDAGGKVAVANRAVHDVLQVPADHLAGQSYEQFLAAEHLSGVRALVGGCLGRPGVRVAREMVLATDRGPVHVQVVLLSHPDAAGAGAGLLGLFEDVTDLVRAQKVATWRAVARRIAHEIKNPLTPIQLSAQRILKRFRAGAEDLPEVLETGVRTIVTEVRGLKQMVDEFSRFARLPEVRPVPGDLNAVLAAAAALYGGHERLRLHLDLAPGLPPVIFDKDLLKRAVVNLLDNAVEATHSRGMVELVSRHDVVRGRALLEVGDDGPGVPAADREKLFLPYFTTKKRGTGLGLAIVERIIADHDGRIRVEDNRPRGARFVIDLPLAHEPVLPSDRNRVTVGVGSGSGPGPGPGAGAGAGAAPAGAS